MFATFVSSVSCILVNSLHIMAGHNDAGANLNV